MAENRVLFDPKPCPKRAQNEAPLEGAIVSGAASLVTKSHRSELNRRPRHVKDGRFSGISQLFNNITRTFSAFLGRKAEKSRPETVPKPCLSNPVWADRDTNLIRRIRFTPEGQQELERAVREELRQFAFRRHY